MDDQYFQCLQPSGRFPENNIRYSSSTGSPYCKCLHENSKQKCTYALKLYIDIKFFYLFIVFLFHIGLKVSQEKNGRKFTNHSHKNAV